MKLTNVLCAVIAALVAGQAGPALAQPYPDRPVVIVPPYPAGGTPDLVARILGEKMAALWGKSVLVEAKPGGNALSVVRKEAGGLPPGID